MVNDSDRLLTAIMKWAWFSSDKSLALWLPWEGKMAVIISVDVGLVSQLTTANLEVMMISIHSDNFSYFARKRRPF